MKVDINLNASKNGHWNCVNKYLTIYGIINSFKRKQSLHMYPFTVLLKKNVAKSTTKTTENSKNKTTKK